jgi:outer membrane receptor for ferrienterochelin and colicin
MLVIGAGPLMLRAQAADTIAPTLVFSPSRYAQSALDAPTAVTVLTADDIWLFGYRTLDELLGAVRGMYGVSDRNYAYVSVRGVQRSGDFNTRLLLLVDGRRVGGLLDDVGLVGTAALVDIDAIARVEVTHGPGSSLYGTSAMYAIINIITRRAATDSGVVARVDLQSHETVRGSVRAARRTSGDADLFGIVSGSRSTGPTLQFPAFRSADNPNGTIRGLDGDASVRALGSMRLGDVHLLAAASHRNKEIPTASYGTVPGAADTRTLESSGLLSAQYEHVYGDLSRVWATASAVMTQQHGRYVYPEALSLDRYRSLTGMVEAQYLRFFGAGHTVIVGGEGRSSGIASIEVRTEPSVSTPVSVDTPSRVYAAFMQSELRLGGTVIAHLGVRHDWYSHEVSAWSPRVGVNWRPRPATAVKVTYGSAFRAPNGYEMNYNDGGFSQIRPIRALRPERMHNTELSIEHGFRPTLQGSVTLYDSHTSQLIGAVPVDTSSIIAFANLDRERFRGAEFALRAIPYRTAQVDAALALQATRSDATGARLVGSPAVVGRLGWKTPLRVSGVVGVAELRGMSARRTLSDQSIPGSATLNLGLNIGRLTRGPTVSAMIWNVFGTIVSDPGGEEHVHDTLPRDGRTFRLAFRWGF